MAGHDTSINIRVSLLTTQILEYWSVCQTKLARAKARKASLPLAYVPQVSGAVHTEARPLATLQPSKSRKSSLQSLQAHIQDKAAATCLVQNFSVLSQRSECPYVSSPTPPLEQQEQQQPHERCLSLTPSTISFATTTSATAAAAAASSSSSPSPTVSISSFDWD